jgi:hypothetical protein
MPHPAGRRPSIAPAPRPSIVPALERGTQNDIQRLCAPMPGGTLIVRPLAPGSPLTASRRASRAARFCPLPNARRVSGCHGPRPCVATAAPGGRDTRPAACYALARLPLGPLSGARPAGPALPSLLLPCLARPANSAPLHTRNRRWAPYYTARPSFPLPFFCCTAVCCRPPPPPRRCCCCCRWRRARLLALAPWVARHRLRNIQQHLTPLGEAEGRARVRVGERLVKGARG